MRQKSEMLDRHWFVYEEGELHSAVCHLVHFKGRSSNAEASAFYLSLGALWAAEAWAKQIKMYQSEKVIKNFATYLHTSLSLVHNGHSARDGHSQSTAGYRGGVDRRRSAFRGSD